MVFEQVLSSFYVAPLRQVESCRSLSFKMDLTQLFDFIRMGSHVESLLKDARDASGLNQTQAMVCWHLLEDEKPGGLNPAVLSRLTGTSLSRLHAQLKRLVAEDLVESLQQPVGAGSRTTTRYTLTELGRQQTRIFVERADCVRGDLWAQFFSGDKERSDLVAWVRISSRRAAPAGDSKKNAMRHRNL